jgi:hypothetical protein
MDGIFDSILNTSQEKERKREIPESEEKDDFKRSKIEEEYIYDLCYFIF